MKPLPANDLEHILTHTGPLWEEVRGKRIFLSGATGFFGAWLLESLLLANRVLKLNLSATVLSRDPDGFARRMPHVAADSSISLWHGNVSSFDVPDYDFPFIVHAAASTNADAAGRPAGLLDTLIDGARHMIGFASRHGARRFLHLSSGAVYGSQPEHISHLREDYRGGPDWLDPASAYAEGKRVAEQLCAIHAGQSSIEFRIARCFAFVGPHLPLDGHFAIGNFIADALAGRAISVRGDGTPLRSYLHAADLAIWLWTMLLHPNPAEANLAVWNVGSAEAISIADLAGMVAGEIHPGLEVNFGRTPTPGAPRQQYVPNVSKAEIELGLRPTISLREAIHRTADWYR